MGWWRIDPETGKPAEESASKLSRPPEFTLLNAVPGVDNDDAAHYLGDGPWDMAASYVERIEKLMGETPRPPEEEARSLFQNRVLPDAMQRLPEESQSQILRAVEDMWADVDGCYEDDWERPARPAERKWICKYAIRCLSGLST